MTQADSVTVKTIGIYPTEQYIVTQVARDLFEGNESQTIRHMIRDYAKRHLTAEQEPQPAGNGQAVLVDPPVPYRAPVLREEVGVPRPSRGVSRED